MTGIRQKLGLAFGGLLAILLIVGGLGVGVLRHYSTALDKFLHENYRSVGYAQRMTDAVDRLNSVADLAARGNLDEARKLAALASEEFEKELGLEFKNITLDGEREAAERLRSEWQAYSGVHARLLDASTGEAERERLRQALLQDHAPRVKQQAQEIARMNLDNMVRKDGQVKRTSAKARGTMIALVAAGIVLAVLVSFVLSRSILHPLRALTKSAREVERGNLDLVVKVRSHDEVGQLAEAFNSMAAKLRELRRVDRARLERTTRTTQTAIDSLPTAVAVLSPEGRLELANEAAQKLFGLRPDTHVSDLGVSAPWLADLFNQVAVSDLPQQSRGYESAVQVFEDGHERFFLPQAVPILDADRHLAGVTVVLADVTNLRKLDEMKSGLLSVVSHELKTPLTSIRMGVHLLLEERVGPLNPKQVELLIAVRDDSDRLNQIIENLLDIGRMETGRSALELKPLAAEQVAADAVEPMRAAYRDKGVALVVDVPADTPQVLADADRIEHVFTNLLGNALKYTPAGGEVRVTAETPEGPSDGAGAFVRFSVSDTGVGIPAEHLPRVFERFFRVPGQSGGSGAGLGLAIAKEIVEAHGGTISAESQPGRGTKFTFTLRRADREAREHAAAASSGGANGDRVPGVEP